MQSWGLRGVQDSLVPPWGFETTGFLLESILPTEEHKPTLHHQLAGQWSCEQAGHGFSHPLSRIGLVLKHRTPLKTLHLQ